MNYGMNPDATDLHEKIGISSERMDEIAKKTKELYLQHKDSGIVPFLKGLMDNFKDVELVWASMGAMRLMSDGMGPLERILMKTQDARRGLTTDNSSNN